MSYKKPNECIYAPAHSVWCETRNCGVCGWNPAVAEARLEAIKQKMAEEEAKKNEQGNAKK